MARNQSTRQFESLNIISRIQEVRTDVQLWKIKNFVWDIMAQEI
jgi:hypothetical protein